VEYALTAPLQIVIIASSFLLNDKSMLMVLGALQGALMLLGYAIELQISKVCKGKRKPKEAHRNRNNGLKLVYLLVSAWALHAVVWYVLVERFNRQKNNLQACGSTEKMPGIVDVIVFGEFLLFTLFGVVQSVHVAAVLSRKNNREYAMLPASMAAESRGEHTQWAAVSCAYGVLSVLAKTLLK